MKITEGELEVLGGYIRAICSQAEARLPRPRERTPSPSAAECEHALTSLAATRAAPATFERQAQLFRSLLHTHRISPENIPPDFRTYLGVAP